MAHHIGSGLQNLYPFEYPFGSEIGRGDQQPPDSTNAKGIRAIKTVWDSVRSLPLAVVHNLHRSDGLFFVVLNVARLARTAFLWRATGMEDCWGTMEGDAHTRACTFRNLGPQMPQ